MTAQHLPEDAAFFDEWAQRTPGARRDLERARRVAETLGVLPLEVPVLAVVGSKGKGTAAICAAATLSSTQQPGGGRARVGLITSPAHRTNRERIRIDGRAIGPADYRAAATRMTRARSTVSSTPAPSTRVSSARSGYLSPTGAYTIAGVDWARRTGADAIVMEEGLGGVSDEISLFTPRIVVATPVFIEHADQLGQTLTEIARDLLGIVRPGTHAIVTSEQPEEVMAVMRAVAQEAGAIIVRLSPEDRRPLAGRSPLTARNADLGALAGRLLADVAGWRTDDAHERRVLATVRLPGRCSRHTTTSGRWMVDGAISPAGVQEAVEQYASWGRDMSVAVGCFPDDKDVAGCFAVLQRAFGTVVPVTSGSRYLSYDRTRALFGEAHSSRDAFAAASDAGGALVVGTQSFVAEALELVDAETESVYDAHVPSA